MRMSLASICQSRSSIDNRRTTPVHGPSHTFFTHCGNKPSVVCPWPAIHTPVKLNKDRNEVYIIETIIVMVTFTRPFLSRRLTSEINPKLWPVWTVVRLSMREKPLARWLKRWVVNDNGYYIWLIKTIITQLPSIIFRVIGLYIGL